MKDKSKQNGQRTSEEDSPEFGEVRVISRPGPDAEDRLRRLFTLLLQHAAGERQDEPQRDALSGGRPAEDHPEAEA